MSITLAQIRTSLAVRKRPYLAARPAPPRRSYRAPVRRIGLRKPTTRKRPVLAAPPSPGEQLLTTGTGKAKAAAINAAVEEILPSAADLVPAVAAVAVPLATLGVFAAAILAPILGKSDKENLWEQQQVAMFSFRPEDIVRVSPFDGNTYHFGNYRGPPPKETALRNSRGGLQ